MTEEELLRQTEQYFRGELSTEEVDELWAEFLRNPERYDLFEAELAARACFADSQPVGESAVESDPVLSNRVKRDILGGQRLWIITAVSLLILVLSLRYLTTFFYEELPVGLWVTIPLDEMVTTELFRDAEMDVHQIEIEINNGLMADLIGDNEEAMRIYRGILSESPPNLHYIVSSINYGVLLYNERRFEESTSIYEQVLERSGDDLPNHLEGKTWWFLGQSLVRQGRLSEAERAVGKSIELEGIYKPDAIVLLQWIRQESDR